MLIIVNNRAAKIMTPVPLNKDAFQVYIIVPLESRRHLFSIWPVFYLFLYVFCYFVCVWVTPDSAQDLVWAWLCTQISSLVSSGD